VLDSRDGLSRPPCYPCCFLHLITSHSRSVNETRRHCARMRQRRAERHAISALSMHCVDRGDEALGGSYYIYCSVSKEPELQVPKLSRWHKRESGLALQYPAHPCCSCSTVRRHAICASDIGLKTSRTRSRVSSMLYVRRGAVLLFMLAPHLSTE
jgi:hypothetical protein